MSAWFGLGFEDAVHFCRCVFIQSARGSYPGQPSAGHLASPPRQRMSKSAQADNISKKSSQWNHTFRESVLTWSTFSSFAACHPPQPSTICNCCFLLESWSPFWFGLICSRAGIILIMDANDSGGGSNSWEIPMLFIYGWLFSIRRNDRSFEIILCSCW